MSVDPGTLSYRLRLAVGATIAIGLSCIAQADDTVGDDADAVPVPATVNLWQQMLRQDLAFARTTLNSRYIHALTPGGETWDKQLAAAVWQAEIDSKLVRDFGGYRAVLRRFAGAFEDAHVRVRFNFQPVRYEWPAFLVRYQSGKYMVVQSGTSAIANGEFINACDGKPIDHLIDEIAPFEGRAKGLESTRAAIARTLFVDDGNPLYKRPGRCKIDNKDVDLQWRPIRSTVLTKLNDEHASFNEPVTAIENFGSNSAWVRIATMGPRNSEQAKQFHDIISHAAQLRVKDLIVLDVRGNGGGSYNWFMAFLRELYGPAYTDYYAQARLQIRPVMLDDPRIARSPADQDPPADQAPAAEFKWQENPLDRPPDTALDDLLKKVVERPAAQGKKVYVVMPDDNWAPPSGPPPSNPVRGRVIVLTDYGCGSACVSFVDEMMLFPGVTQVGRETYVDSRSGTPVNYPFPSGNGAIGVPNMVREGRERGNNVPWRPTSKYEGDIADTEALKKWIETLPVKR